MFVYSAAPLALVPFMPFSGRPLIALLAALAAIGPLSTSLYLPSLPHIRDQLGATTGEAQLTLSASLVGFALLQLVYGPLSDRFGRRWTLAGGLVIYVAANAACALAQAIVPLIGARFVQGVGGCAGAVVARAAVRDQFPPQRMSAVMAVVGMAVSLAPTVAPLIGGQIHEHLGWRAVFVVLMAAGAALLALAWFGLPESPRAGEYGAISLRRIFADYGELLRSRTVLLNSLVLGLGFGGLFAYVAGAPIVLIAMLGVPPDLYGVYTMLGPLGFLTGAFAARRSHGRAPAFMVRLGGAVGLLGGLALLGFALAGWITIATLIVPMFVYSLGLGLSMPNAMSGALSDRPHIAGTASALMGFVQMAVGALGSAMVAALPGETDLPMAFVTAGMAAATLACALALRPR
jgi:DHA1 family bicyclomycin/chloramphenicol resistance-like MFS transporter